ncbi:AAA family ATPase [Ruegeria arenilitoris]|uniref:AAA family ATPase n=1 Tax=Ruegeria arenilitoris TaxID=1173585 RepID=UPI001481481B|nr:AAA family ATPase [Ruegeria arenilitoris]
MRKHAKPTVTHQQLLSLVPTGPLWRVDWGAIWDLWPELAALDDCPQDPVHHAEGDVGTHTRMVVEALVADETWRLLSPDAQSCLFWAAFLHDIGKPYVTRHEEDGRISSRGHSRVGASVARQLLWHAGTPFAWREGLCGIISQHQLPFWLIERDDPQRLAIETSWRCRPDLLCLHARADALGRTCEDQQSILDSVELAVATFEEAGCLNRPFPFANDESRVSYFDLPDRDPHFAAHEEFRCKVTVMSGLPGVGKDTWIGNNRPDQPVVSLDLIRQELGVSATDNQGQVIQAAHERARTYLRAGRGFVWNATNVTRQNRSRILRLLRDYNARIEIVYLEVDPEQLSQQNRNRPDAVPDAVIDHLAKKLEPPEAWEAHRVTIVA